MKKLVMGYAVAGLMALSPTSEARPSYCLAKVLLLRNGQVGVASWYGREHQGKPTASGELFDQNGLTAAHRALPLGTLVCVTNLENRVSALLRVNDRGPGIDSRVIDVSWAAAKQLDFVEAGLTRVEIDVVEYPEAYIHQVGSSSSHSVN
jgi:rare lipoprotein A